MIGRTISHYRILEKLGEGGMGVVYKAQDLTLDRPVALKFLPSHLAASEEEKARFIQEAKASSALAHPNVATIHEIDEVAGDIFIVMEYVDGETLKKKTQERPLPIKDTIDIAIAVAEGLAEAHGQGIIHRDIKSDNVMIAQNGVVKIMDFGLAEIAGRTRVTKEGMTAGTAAYMSPEQAMGEKLNQRTDIWSLGVVLYEIITGRLPFAGDYEQAVVYRILNEEPEPITSLRSNVPMELERIVKKTLRKDREERYQGILELLVDLRSVKKAVESGRVEKEPSKLVSRGKKQWFLIGSIAAALILAMIVWQLLTPTKQAFAGKKSIAVLPFQNFSESKDDEYLADGLTESIITEIAKLQGLLVIARNSVFQYKAKPVNVSQVGKELNVQYVLEGSVQRKGDQLRVNAQLIDASSGFHLWADRYDRMMADLFDVQDEISKNIVTALQLTLTPSEEKQLGEISTKNLQAYDLYLRGRFHLNKSGKASLDEAIALFNQAIALDSRFALAYATLASSYVTKFFSYEPRKEWEEKAFVAIEKALSLNPNLGEAYVARGGLLWTPANNFPHEKAIAEFRRAIALRSNLDEAHEKIALVYMHLGLFEKAIENAKRALEINPGNLMAQYRLGQAAHYQLEYEAALEIYDKLPKHYNPYFKSIATAVAYFGLGRSKQASFLLDTLSRSFPDDVMILSAQAMVSAAARNEQEAEDQIRKTVKLGENYLGHFHHASYWIACAYALLDKRKPAMDWLRRTAEEGFPCYPMFAKDPKLDNLRRDPDFISFMKDLDRQWQNHNATL